MTDDTRGDAPATCAWCGAVAPGGPPLEWTRQAGPRGRGVEYLCGTCARTNLRSIEARLDTEWW
ncbi:MAG TPA: hypothetical protein VF288_03195 [Mycobacteriales bacterium]